MAEPQENILTPDEKADLLKAVYQWAPLAIPSDSEHRNDTAEKRRAIEDTPGYGKLQRQLLARLEKVQIQTENGKKSLLQKYRDSTKDFLAADAAVSREFDALPEADKDQGHRDELYITKYDVGKKRATQEADRQLVSNEVRELMKENGIDLEKLPEKTRERMVSELVNESDVDLEKMPEKTQKRQAAMLAALMASDPLVNRSTSDGRLLEALNYNIDKRIDMQEVVREVTRNGVDPIGGFAQLADIIVDQQHQVDGKLGGNEADLRKLELASRELVRIERRMNKGDSVIDDLFASALSSDYQEKMRVKMNVEREEGAENVLEDKIQSKVRSYIRMGADAQKAIDMLSQTMSIGQLSGQEESVKQAISAMQEESAKVQMLPDVIRANVPQARGPDAPPELPDQVFAPSPTGSAPSVSTQSPKRQQSTRSNP